MMICKLVVILRVHKGIIPLFFYQNENLYGFIVISDFKKRRNLKMAEIENVNNKANVGVTLGGVGLGVALLNAIHNGGGFLSGLFGCGAGNMANAAAT